MFSGCSCSGGVHFTRGEHVAAEQRVVRAELHVHLADVLRLVLRPAAAVSHPAARVGGRRQMRGQLQRRGAEDATGEAIADEGPAQVDGAGRVALRPRRIA